MTRKVFIVADGGHDYSGAEKYGDIVFCTDHLNPISRIDIPSMYREIGSCLSQANRDDYLLVGSLTTMCMIAAGFMADQFGELHLLVYHNNEYIAKDLYFSQEEG